MSCGRSTNFCRALAGVGSSRSVLLRPFSSFESHFRFCGFTPRRWAQSFPQERVSTWNGSSCVDADATLAELVRYEPTTGPMRSRLLESLLYRRAFSFPNRKSLLTSAPRVSLRWTSCRETAFEACKMYSSRGGIMFKKFRRIRVSCRAPRMSDCIDRIGRGDRLASSAKRLLVRTMIKMTMQK